MTRSAKSCSTRSCLKLLPRNRQESLKQERPTPCLRTSCTSPSHHTWRLKNPYLIFHPQQLHTTSVLVLSSAFHRLLCTLSSRCLRKSALRLSSRVMPKTKRSLETLTILDSSWISLKTSNSSRSKLSSRNSSHLQVTKLSSQEMEQNLTRDQLNSEWSTSIFRQLALQQGCHLALKIASLRRCSAPTCLSSTRMLVRFFPPVQRCLWPTAQPSWVRIPTSELRFSSVVSLMLNDPQSWGSRLETCLSRFKSMTRITHSSQLSSITPRDNRRMWRILPQLL